MAKRQKGRAARSKTRMEKSAFSKGVIVPCTIVIIASAIFLIWYINNQNSTYQNIIYIRGFMSSSGDLRDYSNKLGMHNPDTDIKWYKTNKEIRIEFGRIILTWEPKDFYAQENLDLLGTISITAEVKKDAEGNRVLHLYYRGKEIERWVK